MTRSKGLPSARAGAAPGRQPRPPCERASRSSPRPTRRSPTGSALVYDRYGADGLRGRAGPDFADFGSFQDLFDAFFGGDVFGRRGGPRGGDDIGVAVEMSFVESAQATRAVEYDAPGACAACEGSGAAPGARSTLLDVRQAEHGCASSPRPSASSCGRRPAAVPRRRRAALQGLPGVRRPGPYRDRPVALGRHPGGHRERPAGSGSQARRRGQAGRSGRDLYVEVAVAQDPRFAPGRIDG